jgi:AraC family transcriptional regulator, arabinose operon regulatory protein
VLASAATPKAYGEDAAIETAIRFMHAHLTETLRLVDLALRTNTSPSHLHRLFRQKTGRAPIDYFIRLKVQRACELLDHTDMKVGEIAHFLGYRDSHYFSRIFKRVTGQAPREFRVSSRSDNPGFDYHALPGASA